MNSIIRRCTGWLMLLAMCLPHIVLGQAADQDMKREVLFTSYTAFKDSLISAMGQKERLEAFWQRLHDAHQIPFIHGDSVAFLYRGDAERVAWHGDFDGWSRDTTVAAQGKRLGETNLWILETTFPADARLDYKIVRNGSDWMLDPANPRVQWSGFGPNSEIRMPGAVYPRDTIVRPGVSRGTLTETTVFPSTVLGYDVAYRVYTPAGYDSLSQLPVLYVTDGHEYADEHMGSLPAVLDNLIADGRMVPIMAVFVDPRTPGQPDLNRRRSEYADDYEAYATFLTDELVPLIDSEYKTEISPEQRGILGTSLGGLFAAYVGVAHADVFHRIAIHSPAFWYDTQQHQDAVYKRYVAQARLPLQIFMSTGTINDTEEGARRMRALFEEKGYLLSYVEVNEGHSWGNWRALLDDLLIYFWDTSEVDD